MTWGGCSSDIFLFCNASWRLICVYVSNIEKNRKIIFESAGRFLSCSKIIIFLGDFSCVCAPEDMARQQLFRDYSAMVLNYTGNEHELEDIANIVISRRIRITM